MEQNTNLINIIVHEDKSVQKKLQKTARRLKRNYETKRTINEKRLERTKSPLMKVMTIFFDIVVAVLVVFCGMFLFSSLYCRVQKTTPSFAGYSQFKISSESMVASGFLYGDNIIVRAVDASTLKVGDKIAFYKYEESSNKFDIKKCEKQVENSNKKTKYEVSFLSFFGVQSNEKKTAAQAGSKLVFHHIKEIYKDTSTNKYWFKTQGSSNNLPDKWWVEDSMVIGIYDESAMAKTFSVVLSKLTSSQTIIFLIAIPVVLCGTVIILQFLKDVELAKLELDIVQEKRKLTDPICVKYEIGYQMDKKTKYKVLAQAPVDQKVEYLSLLWRDGSAPNALKKYCIRKQMLLATLKKELEIHRKCDQMFKEGVPEREIAKFYHTEKQNLEKDYSTKQKQFKKLRNATDFNSTK